MTLLGSKVPFLFGLCGGSQTDVCWTKLRGGCMPGMVLVQTVLLRITPLTWFTLKGASGFRPTSKGLRRCDWEFSWSWLEECVTSGEGFSVGTAGKSLQWERTVLPNLQTLTTNFGLVAYRCDDLPLRTPQDVKHLSNSLKETKFSPSLIREASRDTAQKSTKEGHNETKKTK